MPVQYEAVQGIATVTLDNPANRNALSQALVAELGQHLDAAASDNDVRAVVLTHTGRTFCAGADLSEVGTDPSQGTRRMLDLLQAIVEHPKPVIARIDGHVRAGGIGLVGACDLAVSGPQTTFAFTEVRLGLAPAIISLTTLTRLNERAAARYYLTGETFGPDEARSMGLITTGLEEFEAILSAVRACSPQGLAETKPLTTRAVRAAFTTQAEELQALSARLFGSEEAREGMTAFLEKRPPRWAV